MFLWEGTECAVSLNLIWTKIPFLNEHSQRATLKGNYSIISVVSVSYSLSISTVSYWILSKSFLHLTSVNHSFQGRAWHPQHETQGLLQSVIYLSSFTPRFSSYTILPTCLTELPSTLWTFHTLSDLSSLCMCFVFRKCPSLGPYLLNEPLIP